MTTATEQTEQVPLIANDDAGGVFHWQNPAPSPVVITRLVIDVVTASTGDSTCKFGSAARSNVRGDNLIDDLNTGLAGTFDNIENAGANGKTCLRLNELEWITGSTASGSVFGIVGFAYITYLLTTA
jgi:hypothetical protein